MWDWRWLAGRGVGECRGFTTQVPIQEVYLTSGRARTLALGARTIRLERGPHWQVALGARPAGQAVRAMAWLGPEEVDSVVGALKEKLSASEWDALRTARAELPSWMARAISAVGVHA
jgi:hypothetical protein